MIAPAERTREGRRARLRWWVAAALLVALATPQVANACAVCYGDVDSPMTKGMNNGILTLLGVVATVQVGFVTLFLSIRRRAHRERRRKERFHLIRGGVG